MDNYAKRIKFKDPDLQSWWEGLSDRRKGELIKAYKCYDEMADTPLLDDLPDRVVTTIRNDRHLYETLHGAMTTDHKERVLNNALQLIGEEWLRFNEVVVTKSMCQHLRGWLEVREMDELVVRCVRAVDLEFERMQREGA